ncbi:O-acetyl-ADP-ribose deacetylase (regulator of RNase III) [Inquilinus ginsengisoli]|uniref:O-acetyl-ADP-ribose deacetylase (Regulator of RNase III) n=1 Tax=Inquilinus ginsengisoli TaxID=363840 RepID=A0ABU1JTW1_9PROT|nr:macro domain-containing protein [Inquilinus ginsengisoli]MDR6292060.1 O-acetyl-ADP-ribose deacetylase (regulator of RNase III) [Inquilinus ginsengisoli]
MQIVLAAKENRLADAWEKTFIDVAEVTVHRGSIFDVACDAVVSPANSYGFMDGGIDALYVDRFGIEVQTRLRRLILDRHHGELLVGSAEVVETGNLAQPFLIAAPTMRVPMVLGPETINPYLATRAVLLLARHGALPTGEPLSNQLRTIAFPGMGTGVGRVPADICAQQMRTAIDEVLLGRYRMPTSWAEASERHQLLYTDRPTRLQY